MYLDDGSNHSVPQARLILNAKSLLFMALRTEEMVNMQKCGALRWGFLDG